MASSYAVFFKTHFWDDFTQRQLARLQAQVGRGDIFIIMDETFGPAANKAAADDAAYRLAGPVISVDMAALEALGLAPVTTHGSILWYNPDYPNYVAAAQLRAYDYYVAVEYDVVVNTAIDDLVDRLASETIDYVGLPIRKPVRDWPWHSLHLDLYGLEMQVALSCFSVFSRAALMRLLERRQAQSLAFAEGALRFWPNNEAFLPNEVRLGGMRFADLTDYGDTVLYDWWPPTNEAALDTLTDSAFIHPVLQGNRFIRSVIYHEPSFTALLNRNSLMWSRLAAFDPDVVRPMVRAEIRRRVRAKTDRLAQRLGLQPKWSVGAQSGAARKVQQASAHNAG